MKETLQKRCDMFIRNRDIIKSAFGWETTYIYPLCAVIFTAKEATADPVRMTRCRSLLKEKTGIFSSFRGTSKMVTVTTLSLSSCPETQMDRLLTVYGDLKSVFFGSDYLTVAASAIAELAEPRQYAQIAQRTRLIYDRMKSAHPFLTSGEDSAFAALLALSGLDDVHIEKEMERCYAILKPEFFSGNAVQSLSHVLALGEAPASEKCKKAMDIFEFLKKRGYKYGTGYELATLGVLALLDTDTGTLAEDMIAADDFLRGQGGFGVFGVGAKQRLMYAGILSMCEYVPNVQTIQTAALSGVVSLVIAQQAAICAAVAATSAAAAASSSNSST